MRVRKPTRVQKQLITKLRLNADNWLVGKNTADGLCIIHRYTGTQKIIPKELMI